MDDKQRAFQEFERSGWEEIARTYTEVAEIATSQVTQALLDAAGVEEGKRVLDVATGPGFVAAAVAERGARPLGLDLAEAMLVEASRRFPGLEFRQGAAEALPFGDGEFDAVVSAFGMPHFADHAAFFAESYRVLRPSGQLAFATWQPVDRNPLLRVVMTAILRGGRVDPTSLPDGPDFTAYGERAHCERTLAEAGFRDVHASDFTVQLPLNEGVSGLLRFIETGSVRTRALYRAQSEEARQRIAEIMGELLESFQEAGGARVPATAIVVSARHP